MKIIFTLLFFAVVALTKGILKDFLVNLWQYVSFILEIMKDIILQIGITDEIIAAIIFIAVMIVSAIAGVSISKRQRKKLKSDIKTTTKVFSALADLKDIAKKC